LILKNPNGNTGYGNTAETVASTGNGLISVGSGGFFTGSPATYPDNADTAEYLAGNFIFSAAGGGCIAQYTDCADGSVSPISGSCSANSVAGSQGQPTATSMYYYVYSTEAADATSKEYYTVSSSSGGSCTPFSRTGIECTAFGTALSTMIRTDATDSYTCSGGAGCTYSTMTAASSITFYSDLGTPSPCDCVPTSPPCTGPSTGTIMGTFPAKRNAIDARKVMQQMLIETNKTMLIPAQFWSDLGDL